jgi:hypothetical protein
MQLEPVAIKFFTAKILPAAAKASDSVSSQARYHTALRKTHEERIEIIEGYYALNQMKVKIVDAEFPDRPPKDCQEIHAWKLEEKQSDVNLALHAYHDAVAGNVDQIVVVTNDTDIAPALEMIRKYTQAVIGLVVPTTDRQRIAKGSRTPISQGWHTGLEPTLRAMNWRQVSCRVLFRAVNRPSSPSPGIRTPRNSRRFSNWRFQFGETGAEPSSGSSNRIHILVGEFQSRCWRLSKEPTKFSPTSGSGLQNTRTRLTAFTCECTCP